MPDTNMMTIYSWACELADVSQLQLTLDVSKIAQVVIEINKMLGDYINKDLIAGRTGLFESFPEDLISIIHNRIDDIQRHHHPDERNEKYRKSIGMRLWSGCLSAAKAIALETNDGPTTPDTRAETFHELDLLSDRDAIFRAGAESAPLFKKHNQQCYSFMGISLSSPVRKYPNDYLIDR